MPAAECWRGGTDSAEAARRWGLQEVHLSQTRHRGTESCSPGVQ